MDMSDHDSAQDFTATRAGRLFLARALSEVEAEAAGRIARVEARHTAAIAREARLCTALQQRLFELEAALRTVEERRASEAGDFADQVARRHSEFTASLTQTLHARDSLAIELSAVTAALDEAQEARRADAAVAAEHLRRREAELSAALAEADVVRAALERELDAAHAAYTEARARADMDLAAASERQAALDDLLGQEADRCAALEQKLAAADAALEDAGDRHTTELARAAARLADVQAQFDAAVSDHAAMRAAFEEQLAAAAEREADLAAALGQADGARAALERGLEDAEAAHRDARARAESDLAAARERYTALEAMLAREADTRAGLEQRLDASEAAFEYARDRHADDMARAAARLAGVQAQFDAAVSDHAAAQAAHEEQLADAIGREADLAERLADFGLQTARRRRRSARTVSAHRRRSREQRLVLEGQLAALRADAARERDEWSAALHEERQAHERTRLSAAADLQRVSAEYDHLRDSFGRLQTAFQTLEGIAGEHAAERARLEAVVAVRDSELTAQSQRHRAAEQAAQEAFARTEERLRETIAASAADVVRLQQESDGLRRELGTARAHAAALRGEAERVPNLQAQLELSEKERRREFERAPYGLCHCTPEGLILDANHAFAAMLGRRRADDLRHQDFAAAVVDCAGDLGWLLERTQTARRSEPVETAWRTKDGRDLVVRLQAFVTAAGNVEIVAEDVTRPRALEDRLRQAQRMEAVGRLASEVAATCDALLGDVARGVREWATISGGADALRQGDRLLTDVTRTASYLRQLGVYGDQQVRALERVSVQRVLADLAPVLKRVVGDQIALVLSKFSGSFDVDVEAERLERVLINVAGYARERMPAGGQMRIDVAATALGRRFVSRYPNVRPGHHVLITVTELPRPGAAESADAAAARTERPGVELTALVDLVATCGGHLWLEAQPAGNLVVKIYLPRRTWANGPDTKTPSVRTERSGRLARWFRAAPVLRMRA